MLFYTYTAYLITINAQHSKKTLKFQMSLWDTKILLLQLQYDRVSCEDKNER